MRRMLRLIFAALMVSGWLLAAASLHVLIMPGWQFGLLPKDRLTFTDTYVDARAWTAADAAAHPELVKRITDSGHAEWLSTVTGTPGVALDEKLRELIAAGAKSHK